jgi:hypothetical protein
MPLKARQYIIRGIKSRRVGWTGAACVGKVRNAFETENPKGRDHL